MKEVKEILEITRKAGELLRKMSLDPENRKPQAKGDGSPVTKADLEVSRFLVQSLQPMGYPVISEEALPETPPAKDESYFLLDPLDGTKYFARGEDEFAVCVGLLKQGKPYFGAIYDPTASQLFWAVEGQGAFCDDQAIQHSGVPGLARTFSSGFHKKPGREKVIQALDIGEILEKGSALKFCDLAEGKADLYLRFGPTSEWDTAAAQVLLTEANCVLYEAYTLEPMQYGKANYLNRGIIACHQSLQDKVIRFFKENGQELIKKRYDQKEKAGIDG